MKRIVIFLIHGYQCYISPLKKPCCRFYPTCSQYALQAFQTYGFFKAMGLTIWRILRCNPLCKGGFDPLPPKKQSKREEI